MALGGVFINIGLNLYWIPKYGVSGAAFASLITQALTAIAQIILSYRIVSLKIQYLDWARIIIFAGLAILSTLGLEHLDILWGYKALIFISGATLLAFLTGMISIRGLLKILAEKQ